MNFAIVDHEAARKVAQRTKTRTMLRRHRWFLLFVAAPTLLSAIYYGFIASDVYVSQSSFVIKSPGQKTAPTLSLANLVQTTGLSIGQEQTKEVVEYVRSRDALKNLEARTDVRKKYSGRGADFLSRFPRPFHRDTFENLYRFYGSMVGADVDPQSGMAVLQVRAFTAQD